MGCISMDPGFHLRPSPSSLDTPVRHDMHKTVDDKGFELKKLHYFEGLS